jgi:hypothetical protein
VGATRLLSFASISTYAIALGCCLFALVTGGCSSGEGAHHPSPSGAIASPSSKTVAPSTPDPTVTEDTGSNGRVVFQAKGSRVGVTPIDVVLGAVENGDAGSLSALIAFSDLPCVMNPQGLGSPPKCPAGVSSGSLVSVFPLSRCESGFADREQTAAALDQALSRHVQLYAVYEEGPRPEPGEPAYVALFGFQETQPSGVFRILMRKDGAIVGLGLCPPPGSLSFQNAGSMILPPRMP